MEDIRETFSYFDKTGSNTIDPNDMENFLFACGLNPLRSEMKKINEELGPNPVNFETACAHYQSVSSKAGDMSKEQLCEIFKPFDREGNGHILIPEFRSITTQLGDKLIDEEVNQVLGFIETAANGTIAYEVLGPGPGT
ncbi:hypothetical protein MXB_1796 [Myxobolus squamalis]|nr:hypothetical protein MXB_1796 [Myxobolus squamalis]